MNRRNFIYLLGCGCFSLGLHSCTTAPITERRQLKLIPESKLNAQAAQIFEKVKFGKIKIRIFKRYKLSEAKYAHADLEARKLTGPSILIP